MADESQLERLKRGVAGWNAWRAEHPEVGIDLRDADLAGAHLEDAHLEGADLEGADVLRANLTGANLGRANLESAHLAEAFFGEAKLERATLAGADLGFAVLSDANLEGANLDRADLAGANLTSAHLEGANLEGANLDRADLAGAHLEGANLEGANLAGAYLEDAYLERANLKHTTLANTHFAAVDLRQVQGLDEVKPIGPSSVDHRTLARSHGQIPEIFLRGCGFQDWEVAAAKLYDPELSGEQVIDIVYEIERLRGRSPIQINPLFISYSREDAAFVEALEPGFDAKGIRYWRDVHHATSGPLEEQIERAIRVHPTFLLVLSEHSVASDWVEMEAEKARRLEKELRKRGERRHVLCPVALDGAWQTAAWPERLLNQIKKYNILDFSDWQSEEVLEGMFERLLEGLGIYYRSKE